MAGSVEIMCAVCANLRENGSCKLAWVTKKDQQDRAIQVFAKTLR